MKGILRYMSRKIYHQEQTEKKRLYVEQYLNEGTFSPPNCTAPGSLIQPETGHWSVIEFRNSEEPTLAKRRHISSRTFCFVTNILEFRPDRVVDLIQMNTLPV